jgi:glycosyltransferase involved in cell wall biosynthesis
LNKKNNYDFIHCNSVVTIGFLNRLKRFGFLKNLNTILHVRELLVNSLPLKYKKRLNQINRFICISDDTKHALTKVLSKKKKTCVDVINNPFNPGSFKLSTKIQNKLKKNITYFALAGLVTEGKGVEFVLDSFLKAKLAKSILLVVGYGNDFKKLVKKFKRENNIKFLGEIKNLGLTNFYEKIDFLIRGDKTTGVGRTVFEALYSGCKIILPKYNNDKLDRNLKNFKNEIQYYTPRSKRQLIKLFQSIKRTKNTTKRKKINNLNYYTSSILNVYSKL